MKNINIVDNFYPNLGKRGDPYTKKTKKNIFFLYYIVYYGYQSIELDETIENICILYDKKQKHFVVIIQFCIYSK